MPPGPFTCVPLHWQVYSRPSSLVSSSPQRSTSSDADGERPFNLNGNSVPTATQTLMTMYRRRSPEEFNPKLVGAFFCPLKIAGLEQKKTKHFKIYFRYFWVCVCVCVCTYMQLEARGSSDPLEVEL